MKFLKRGSGSKQGEEAGCDHNTGYPQENPEIPYKEPDSRLITMKT